MIQPEDGVQDHVDHVVLLCCDETGELARSSGYLPVNADCTEGWLLPAVSACVLRGVKDPRRAVGVSA